MANVFIIGGLAGAIYMRASQPSSSLQHPPPLVGAADTLSPADRDASCNFFLWKDADARAAVQVREEEARGRAARGGVAAAWSALCCAWSFVTGLPPLCVQLGMCFGWLEWLAGLPCARGTPPRVGSHRRLGPAHAHLHTQLRPVTLAAAEP